MLWSSDEVCSRVAFISIFYKMAPQIVFFGILCTSSFCWPRISVLLNLSLVNSSSFIFIPAVLSGVGWFVYSLSLGMWFPRYKLGSLCVSLVRVKTLTSHFNSSRASSTNGFMWNSRVNSSMPYFFWGMHLQGKLFKALWLSRGRKTSQLSFLLEFLHLTQRWLYPYWWRLNENSVECIHFLQKSQTSGF